MKGSHGNLKCNYHMYETFSTKINLKISNVMHFE